MTIIETTMKTYGIALSAAILFGFSGNKSYAQLNLKPAHEIVMPQTSFTTSIYDKNENLVKPEWSNAPFYYDERNPRDVYGLIFSNVATAGQLLGEYAEIRDGNGRVIAKGNPSNSEIAKYLGDKSSDSLREKIAGYLPQALTYSKQRDKCIALDSRLDNSMSNLSMLEYGVANPWILESNKQEIREIRTKVDSCYGQLAKSLPKSLDDFVFINLGDELPTLSADESRFVCAAGEKTDAKFAIHPHSPAGWIKPIYGEPSEVYCMFEISSD